MTTWTNLIGTKFRDFRNSQKIAKLKTRETYFYVYICLMFITYFWPNRENKTPWNIISPKLQKLSTREIKYR